MLRKIYRTIFPAKPSPNELANVQKGNSNIIIDPSAILVTPPNSKITLQGDNYIGRQVEIGPISEIEIGFGTSLQDRCILLGDIEIGKYCTFAPNVYISSGRHYYSHKPDFYIKDQDVMVAKDKELSKQHSKKVTIGDDCWLGINSVIMSGITIGRGCIIGANSVVTKDVEPYSVVAGSPAKLIKKRLVFETKTIVNYNNENDLPNFYKGVWVNKTAFDKYQKEGGLAACRDFSIYLGTQARKISIEIKRINSSALSINYNRQTFKLEGDSFTTLTFDIGSDNYHTFNIDGIANKNEICVLIKKVELKN